METHSEKHCQSSPGPRQPKPTGRHECVNHRPRGLRALVEYTEAPQEGLGFRITSDRGLQSTKHVWRKRSLPTGDSKTEVRNAVNCPLTWPPVPACLSQFLSFLQDVTRCTCGQARRCGQELVKDEQDTRGRRNVTHRWKVEGRNPSFLQRKQAVLATDVHTQSLSHVWLCDLMNCSLPGSCVHGILQTRILEWVAISSSRGSSWPRDRTRVSYVSCIAGRLFTRYWGPR